MTDMMEMILEEEDTLKGRFLTFSLEGESYGIEIRYVTEIIKIQAITQMPELPEYMKGIINMRGKIIPVMDIRLRFKKKPEDYNDRTCIIVIDISGLNVGLIVDNVAEVLTIEEENIVDPPQITQAGNRYIKSIGRVGNDVKLILNCEKLLTEEEVSTISQAL